ncbi:MAG: hypothetical protein NC392_06880 [Roseburia sp.]|nr:hypothetical protein [Roseburia sp.]
MNVYHNTSLWNKQEKQGASPLSKLPVDRTVQWAGQEIYIPAVYVGAQGAVLDVCARIPAAEMTVFLRKWNKERRLSLKTPEDYELIDADNPSAREFTVEICFDDIPLTPRASSSLNWYPQDVFLAGNELSETSVKSNIEEWKNDKIANSLMEAYACDRTCCWHFERLSYDWKGGPLLSPHHISLTFQARCIAVTTTHFTTAAPCTADITCAADTACTVCADSQEQISSAPACYLQDDCLTKNFPASLKIRHPATGREHTLTLYECRHIRHEITDIGMKDVTYPEYAQVLTYSVSPEIDRSIFDIRDCEEGDQPVFGSVQKSRKKTASSSAVSVFVADKDSFPDSRTSVSSLHFKPQEKVRWRTIFQIQPRENLEVRFSL